MSYLCYLCLLVYSGVQHILCWFVCFRLVLCCQFLWIVHFWYPLRFSLTFIRLLSRDIVTQNTEYQIRLFLNTCTWNKSCWKDRIENVFIFFYRSIFLLAYLDCCSTVHIYICLLCLSSIHTYNHVCLLWFTVYLIICQWGCFYMINRQILLLDIITWHLTLI